MRTDSTDTVPLDLSLEGDQRYFFVLLGGEFLFSLRIIVNDPINHGF